MLVVPAPAGMLGLRMHAGRSLPVPVPAQPPPQPQPSTASSVQPAQDAACKPVGRSASRPVASALWAATCPERGRERRG